MRPAIVWLYFCGALLFTAYTEDRLEGPVRTLGAATWPFITTAAGVIAVTDLIGITNIIPKEPRDDEQ